MVDREITLGWTPDYVDYGQIKWSSDPHSTFEYQGNKTIKKIDTNCPCVSVKITLENGIYKIHSVWKPRKPDNAFYSSMKRIMIYYTDHTRDLITLKATITL